MAVHVIDQLEAVEVDQHHCAATPRQHPLDPVEQQMPVGQARQVVVGRLVGEFALESTLLGDVLDDSHEGRCLAVATQDRSDPSVRHDLASITPNKSVIDRCWEFSAKTRPS